MIIYICTSEILKPLTQIQHPFLFVWAGRENCQRLLKWNTPMNSWFFMIIFLFFSDSDDSASKEARIEKGSILK